MKKSLKVMTSMLLGLSLMTGCFSSGGETETNNDVIEQPQTEDDSDGGQADDGNNADGQYTPDLSKSIELSLSVFYQSPVYMTYTADGGNNRPQSEYVAANGKTYRDGDFKPVWEELQERLNFTINDVTPSDAQTIVAAFTSLQAQNFSGVDIMVGNSLDISKEGVTNKTFLPIDEYMEYMPNFRSFLDENGVVEISITAGDGHIYYVPYFDGFNEVQRMMMLRVDWVEKLLNDDSAAYDTDRVVDAHYEPYMPESLSVDINAVKADGSGTQTIKKEYSENIITKQNNLDVLNGENLTKALIEHIDNTYGDQFAKRSDLFCGQDAAYDADELVALMRCIFANTTMLTGQSDYDVVPFFPRTYQSGRIMDLYRFAEIWGVRGLMSQRDWFYFDENGELRDARFEEDTMDGLERLNQLYREKLILQDFDKDEATSGLSGSDHRDRLLRANLGFMTLDYNQTSTVYNSLGDEGNETFIDGFNFTPVLPPVAQWQKDGNYYQFTESWRSVHVTGWGILNTVASDEDKLLRALALFDYQYSPEGNRLMSYGPEAWIDGEIEYGGKMVPRLSDKALEELASLAGGNYTNYYRMWLGATFPIGYIKEQGMEYQTVHEKGKVGLEYLLKACELGTMKHVVMDKDQASSPTFVIVPTTFAVAEPEQLFIQDNCADLITSFLDGNNDYDRVIFTDYVIFGFGSTTSGGDQLLDKEGLISYIRDDLKGESYRQIYSESYARMVK